MKGKVVLVGAGPGDPELITVKGLKALKDADVVLYDRLVPKELLKEVKSSAELIYVGKEAYGEKIPQEEITKLMVKKAKEGKTVVRLKGGDPMVFGRGGEELITLAKEGINFYVIPGVSSATAAPTVANIPLTFRGISSSFAVVTGHEASGKKRCVNLRKIAEAVDTIVVLMGLKRLKEICNELIKGGLPLNTPIALIEKATTSEQKVVIGTLENIVEKTRAFSVEPPVVIVIGKVVDFKRQLDD